MPLQMQWAKQSKRYIWKMEGNYLEEVVKEGSPEKVTFELKYELGGEKKIPGGGNRGCDNPKEGCFQWLFEEEWEDQGGWNT